MITAMNANLEGFGHVLQNLLAHDLVLAVHMSDHPTRTQPERQSGSKPHTLVFLCSEEKVPSKSARILVLKAFSMTCSVSNRDSASSSELSPRGDSASPFSATQHKQ
jgi:hypothetical protein